MSTSAIAQYSTEIPEILRPFYSGKGTPGEADYQPGLIERGISSIFPGKLSGQAAYQAQFSPVIQAGLMGSGSVAGLSPFQTALGQQLGSMNLPGQYQLGTQAGQQAAAGFQGLQNVQAPSLSQYQLTLPDKFTSDISKQYMSPYMQDVVSRQQESAITAAKQAQLGQNLAAARQGTYGGARQAVLQKGREDALKLQLADIQAKGLQSAYEQAQAQFERDRAAQERAGQANLQASLSVQQANQQAALQAAQQRLGASQGLAGLTGTLGQLGTQQMAGQLDLLKTQGAFGDLQRAIQQQQMDAQRQMLMDQAQYGQTQVGQLSGLLRGIPMTSATQTTTTPPPSFASQLTGLGLTGVGLYNMLGGGKQ